LFDQLQQRKVGTVNFQPYGRETIEVMAGNMNILESGGWPPRTTKDILFPFRATATETSGFMPTRFTVKVGDYAGEHIGELDPTSERWLHRTEYFDYVVASDVIFLAVDVQRKLDPDPGACEEMVNNLTSALQVLIDKRDIPAGRTFRAPVALLVLKSDLLNEGSHTQDAITVKLGKLIRVCETRCRSFSRFFVSAVGNVREDGSPPSPLEPMNVTDPIVWALGRVSK
jgi:hypothetical protein